MSKKYFNLVLAFSITAVLYVLILVIIKSAIPLGFATDIDYQIASFFESIRFSFLNNVFLWITLFGKFIVAGSFIAGFSLLLFIWGKREYIFPLFVSVIGASSLNYLSKILMHRERPINSLYLENSFSFPSGHATIAIAFYGFVLFILWREITRKKIKLTTLYCGIALILLIGFSRLYLGVHFLTDILGGYLLGLFGLFAGILAYFWQKEKHFFRNVKPITNIKELTFEIVAAMVVFYIAFGMFFLYS